VQACRGGEKNVCFGERGEREGKGNGSLSSNIHLEKKENHTKKEKKEKGKIYFLWSTEEKREAGMMVECNKGKRLTEQKGQIHIYLS